MGRNLKAILKVAKKYRSGGQYRARYYFTKWYEKNLPIDDGVVLFQSFDGKNFGGNPFYMLNEMRKHAEWDNLSAIIAVNADAVERTRVLISAHGFRDCRIIAIHSDEYCRWLSCAKYLVNNSTFPTYFIKRKGQVYLNTWHGTPLKTMGRKMSDRPHTTGNTQRNFLMSDYLLYPNRFSFNHFREDYMIDKYYTGKYLLSGYPCNTIFFDGDARRAAREKLGITDGTRMVVYMPTWRQTQVGGHRRKHFDMAEFFLMNLDETLAENVEVYAKLHYYDSGKKISFNQYKKIHEFPQDMETYEVLNAADILVTDYSSVMFDFLNAGKEVLLYNYDEGEYFSNRGTYLSMSELPFRRTHDSYELCDWINNASSQFEDSPYREATRRFCTYDGKEAAYKLCQLLFSEESAERLGIVSIDGSEYHTNKKKVLIFGGALTKNGLTTALLGILNNVDLDENDYMLTFYAQKGRKAIDVINSLDEHLSYFPMQGNQTLTYPEAIARFLYYRFNCTTKWVQRKMDSLYRREAKRLFPGMHFDSAIHFTGYERSMVHTLLNCDVKNRVIYVHNDMIRERDLRANYHVPAITLAYQQFDKIAVVRESLIDIISNGFKVPREKIHTAHNLNMIEQIRKKSALPVSFDDETVCNVSLDELNTVLDDRTVTKFIDVARFSPEKGLERLIDAYVRYHHENPNSVLIIVGGHGSDYQKICERVHELDDARVILIRNLSNPLNIVAKSDVFVLSSFYEGLPMSIMEALILHKPVVSTAITGPKEFLEQGYGYLVEDSEEGLYRGMCAYKQGLLNSLKPFDAEKFNEQALHEFKDLIE